MPRLFRTLEEKIKNFWSYVIKTEDHWLWQGKTDKDGYGAAWWNHKQQRAHRVAYEIAYGEELPFGIDLHHKLDCPKNCVRPNHLKEILHSSHASMHSKGRRSCGTSYRRTSILM